MSKELFRIHVMPRHTMSWAEFMQTTPPASIALDGIVYGGPRFHFATSHVNFDHHDGVVREATMSTAMQVYMAIKGGLVDCFVAHSADKFIHIYINDTDQDTSLAVWLLLHYKLFEGVQSIPHINRLLDINNKWDITGGAYPQNLDASVVRQHFWVFEPYAKLRKSGMLARGDESVLRCNLEAVLRRLDKYLMHEAEEVDLDDRYEIFYENARYKIVNEIGGNEARYYLFNHGMNCFISLVATRPDGRSVWTIGKRSQYYDFPICDLYDDFNKAEGLVLANGWNGSDLIGGASRSSGSTLSWQELRDITNRRLGIA